ncbi:hypothetical protein LPJ57_010418, partial [Coemansia sp. RSA 486]
IEERPGGYKQIDTAAYGTADNASTRDNGRSDTDAVGYSDYVQNTGGSSDERSSYFSRRNAGSRTSRRETYQRARGKGKERADLAGDRADASYIRITRSEWESLNAELASLRAAVGSNVHILQAIAQHLSIPSAPSQPRSRSGTPSQS